MILIIDDEEGACEILRRQLEPIGVEVRCAKTIAEAFREITSYDTPPELLLLDMRLPDSPSDEATLHRITDFLKASPNAAIIVQTGYATDAMARKALELGASSFLDKNQIGSQVKLWNSIKDSLHSKSLMGRPLTERQNWLLNTIAQKLRLTPKS